jgi:enoyl-CoA hydratase
MNAPDDHFLASLPSYEFIRYEVIDAEHIAVISLSRARYRNAQNRGMLLELDAAFRHAEQDDDVRVVVLRGDGPSFSAGHDLGSPEDAAERDPETGHESYRVDGGSRDGIEKHMLQEWHHYYQSSLRWRNLRKVTIAAVHGHVYASGLSLAWPCDLIVAAEGAQFADIAPLRLGVCGIEYFAHPFELGPRRAKELLLTGDAIDADEAYRIGMVNKVFPRASFEADTIKFARRIAALPSFTSLLVKDAVNQAVDAMGFVPALNAAFSLQNINHAHWMLDPEVGTASRRDGWRTKDPVRLAVRDLPEGPPASGAAPRSDTP